VVKDGKAMEKVELICSKGWLNNGESWLNTLEIQFNWLNSSKI
jgi:hypothetical protein